MTAKRPTRRSRKGRSSRRSGTASKPKLFIELGAAPNVDYGPEERLGWVQMPKQLRGIRTLLEGSVVAMQFIHENGLGGGNWGGFGNIVDDRGRVVAHVSYNGRLWDPKDKEILPGSRKALKVWA
jgi:hypothetical protein